LILLLIRRLSGDWCGRGIDVSFSTLKEFEELVPIAGVAPKDMLLVPWVRPDKRAAIPAVTHLTAPAVCRR